MDIKKSQRIPQHPTAGASLFLPMGFFMSLMAVETVVSLVPTLAETLGLSLETETNAAPITLGI